MKLFAFAALVAITSGIRLPETPQDHGVPMATPIHSHWDVSKNKPNAVLNGLPWPAPATSP